MDPTSMLVIIAILLGLLLFEVGRIMVATQKLVDLQSKALEQAKYQSGRLQELTRSEPTQEQTR